ncbi:hypothetical protein FSPOR_6181 [Fusarium sporotrichioides]|uniref:Peptidase S33 tripeptidyl aminopeptidase-like C-terminal domain-containing protein n=1 Tax=Fusarium sporotrichioides TaxID=5514 RepID=A0A395S4F9_FUSSP|nr:hypothetical protein FSPOR_6181 [Fusarium sporotrichioides]
MKMLYDRFAPLLLGTSQLLFSRVSLAQDASTLKWGPCDLDLPEELLKPGDCATIEVPLDYTNSSSEKTVELQLLRYNATKEPFKGTVFWNPGGPGISGIETFAYLGQDFRDILGGHHNMISFDPRSIDAMPQADLWEYVKNEAWESMQKVAEACYETQKENGRFLSTAFTARDMMKIVDALGEDGKLRFWGISYGTILGQVAASLFPDRIERLLLDSNSLADAYFTSTGIGGPKDAEKSLVHLFTECVELGTDVCRLANYSGSKTTVEDLRDATVNLFQKLKDMTDLPEGLSSADYPYAGNSILKELKNGIMNLLSSPFTYSTVVELLSYAFDGDYKKALSLYKEDASEWNLGKNSFQGIACSETSLRVKTPEDLYSLYQAHLAESSFGDAIAADYMACGAWKFDAAEGVDTNTLRNINTSFPVFVVNNAYDPITSLSHAYQVSSRFRDSRVLVNEGVGHGVTSHSSDCLLKAISSYFIDGTLPEVGATCKPEEGAFEYALSRS